MNPYLPSKSENQGDQNRGQQWWKSDDRQSLDQIKSITLDIYVFGILNKKWQ